LAQRAGRSSTVSLNCAAIPEGLLESELFGFERGAFTGAHTAYAGASASRGRHAVLRRDRRYEPVGAGEDPAGHRGEGSLPAWGHRSIPIDVRIVAATNDLETMMATQRFRKDLYYRLDVAHIHSPPLRSAPRTSADLRALPGRDECALGPHGAPSREALTCPCACVARQRTRVAQRARGDFHQPVESGRAELHRAHLLSKLSVLVVEAPGRENTSECERLLAALFAVDWNKSKAAEALHWSRMTLYRKMAKYHIERDPKPAETRRHEGRNPGQSREQ
jgi:DNA-binding NtrC family response regulator